MRDGITAIAVWLSQSAELSLLVKATVILMVALMAMRLTRRARASVRHLVIATGFGALLALPVLLAVAPPITVDLPVSAFYGDHAVTIVDVPPQNPAPLTAAIDVPRRVVQAIGLADTLRAIWLIGTLLFLIPVAAVLWRLSTIRRTGLPVAWHRDALAQLAASRGVSRPVELVEHEAVPGPMTFGVNRPVIVLPIDARDWSDAELRRALLHELEHIQRGDWIMQIVARVVAAFYWFHPLVWMAWRRLGLEAERSCDDAVVMSEERTDYAEQLVTLAQRMSATPVQPLLGMANRSDLSTRVTAVLDDRLRRGRAGFALVGRTVVASAIVVATVAPVRAVAKPDPELVAMSEESSQRRTAGDRKSRALDTELYEAANEGDYAGVRELVEGGANANAVIDGDGSPLIGAARSGRILITEYLLDHGADPNQAVPGDGSPLIVAAALGRLDQVALLISRGADVNLAVDGDENPLMNAAEGSHIDVVKFLIDKGADIHTRIRAERWNGRRSEDEWRTALSQARKSGRMNVVRYLESLGARE
jgi:beta-lactamase regulating signal transducer with metallopeptidase domain